MTVFVRVHFKNNDYCALRILFTSFIVIAVCFFVCLFLQLKASLNLQRKAIGKERPK
jgi:hypothetical protein